MITHPNNMIISIMITVIITRLIIRQIHKRKTMAMITIIINTKMKVSINMITKLIK